MVNPITDTAQIDMTNNIHFIRKKQNSIFNWGTVGVLCQPPDTLVKGGWC